MKDLLQFLQSQRVLVIASSEENIPWITNVYFSVSRDMEFFFVTSSDSKHGKQFAQNNRVAVSTVWYAPDNLENRKGIQGAGSVQQITSKSEFEGLFTNHLRFYPDWDGWMTWEKIKNNTVHSKPYVFRPSYIKFFNDELYGDEGIKEFKFQKVLVPESNSG